jgi:hypothetical protein
MRWFSKLWLFAALTISVASGQTLGPPGSGSGSSGVSSIAVTCGIAASASTGAVTIGGETVDNPIAATTDTINSGDCGRTERYTGASAAVTVPASTGFPVSFTTDIKCEATIACVLTPSGTTINGSASAITVCVGNSITLYLDLSGTPVWHTKPGNPTTNSIVVNSTFNLATASGAQVVSGFGFTPSTCDGFGVVNAGPLTQYTALNSHSDNAGSQATISIGAGALLFNGNVFFNLADATSANTQTAILSYGAGSVTLTWTKTGSPAGTFSFSIRCFK